MEDENVKTQGERLMLQDMRFLSALLDNLSEAVVLHDKSLKVIWANNAAGRSMGLMPRDIAGLQCFQARHRQTAFCPDCPVKRASESLRPEESIILSGGDAAHLRAYPLLDENGELQGVLEIAVEIVDRRVHPTGRISSAELCTTLIQQAPTYIVVLNSAGDILMINPAMLDHTGYEQKELIGRNYFSYFVPPDVQKQLRRDIRESAAGRQYVSDEHTVLTKDGRALIVNWYISPLFGEDGRLLYYFAIGADVTEQKQAESDLRESQRLLSTLMSNLPGMAYRCRNDRDWTMEFVSRGCTALTGYAPRDLIDNQTVSYASLIHPDDQDRIWNEVQKAVQDRKSFLLEYRLRTKDGETKWVWKRGRGMFSPTGELLALEGIITDVSAKRRAMDALTAEKERLEVTLRSIGDGVITVNVEGRVNLFSRAAQALTGWSADEAMNQPIERVFHAIDKQTGKALDFPLLMAMAVGDAERENEVVLLPRGDHERLSVLNIAPLHDARGEIMGLVLVFRDITERVKQDEQRRRVERLEAVELLAGGIARDFDTLLSAFREQFQQATEKIATPDEARQHLAEIERIADAAADLTKRLLTFATGGRPAKTQISVRPLIEEGVRRVFAGTAVNCDLVLADDLWPLEADQDQLRLVIDCFFEHLRERLPAEGRLKVSLANEKIGPGKKTRLPAGHYVRVLLHAPEVEMPRHSRDKVFDPYFLAQERGAGLRLAIAHSIIRMHGGLATVDGGNGHGAVFDIYLPAVPPAAKRASASDRAAQRGKILLMDDDDLIIQVTGSLLNHLGHECVAASDGEQMLEQYAAAMQRGEPFDAVILDIAAPRGMGGEEAVRRLLALDPKARVIVTSGDVDDPAVTNFAAHGFRGHLAKPFQIKDLSRVLEKVLNDRA